MIFFIINSKKEEIKMYVRLLTKMDAIFFNFTNILQVFITNSNIWEILMMIVILKLRKDLTNILLILYFWQNIWVLKIIQIINK